MKRAIFIGQAMPRYKGTPHDWKSLNLWLYSIGITDDLIKNIFTTRHLLITFPVQKEVPTEFLQSPRFKTRGTGSLMRLPVLRRK